MNITAQSMPIIDFSMITPTHPTLPPFPATTLFLLPILGQAFLLHSAFRTSRLSRYLRLLLIIPGLICSVITPFLYRVEPIEYSGSINFRWGIFGPFFALRTLEYGLAKDGNAYKWIGFKMTSGEISKENPPSRSGSLSKMVDKDAGADIIVNRMKDKTIAKEVTSWTSILASTLYMFTSMRGNGYGFGQPPATPIKPVSNQQFLKAALTNLFFSHLLSTLCTMLLVTPHLSRTSLLLPILPPAIAEFISHTSSHIAVGFSLLAQMSIGKDSLALLFLFGTVILRRLNYDVAPFNSLEYPPLFDRPFEMESVTQFWARSWHSLFRKPFLTVGYWPVAGFFKSIGLSALGKIIGIYVVFALSAMMHHVALLSALNGLPPDHEPLSFISEYGGPIFFMTQATAVVLEASFTKMTGRKVKGRYGRAWAYLIVIAVGTIAGRSWLEMGLVRGLPMVQSWSWERFIIPNACLLPPPLFTR